MNLLEQAIEYKSRGWSIIPIQAKSKKPAVSWKKYQTELATDAELEKWFKDKIVKDVGIGLVTGKLSNIVVIDLDSYKKGAEVIDLNTPLISKTGGGGKHGFFAYQDGIKNKVNINNSAIDIRGEGGYVVLPPSGHPSGGTYEWIAHRKDDVLPPVPDQFIKKWKESGSDSLRVSEHVNVSAGSRNDSLYKLACSHISKLGEEQAKVTIDAVNQTYSPPLKEKEVSILFNSAASFVKQSPPVNPTTGEKVKSSNEKTKESFLVGKPVKWNDIEAISLEDKWIWENYIAKGNSTLLTAIMKSGKSTFLRCLLEAIGKEEEFAGQPTKKVNVLVISEESNDIWKENREEISNRKDIDHVAVWVRPTRGKPNHKQWDEVIREITTLCLKEKIELIIIDTLTSFWPIDNENDSAQVAKALLPLYRLTEEGVAVLLVHHDRKGGGDFGESSRGSSALTGWVDNIIQFKRDTNGLPSHRILKTWGRFPNVIPSVLLDYTNDGKYETKGDPWVVSKSAKLEKILSIFGEYDDPLSIQSLFSYWNTKIGEISKRSIGRYVKGLVENRQLKVDREELVQGKKVVLYAQTGWVEGDSGQLNTPPSRVVLSNVAPKEPVQGDPNFSLNSLDKTTPLAKRGKNVQDKDYRIPKKLYEK